MVSCSERENLTLTEELQKLSTPPQVFTIEHDREERITTMEGTSVIIPPNAFLFSDGTEVNGSIEIEIEEIFDKSNMVLKGIGTSSDGRLLESYGMIKLTATSNDSPLKLKDGLALTVTIPNKKHGINGELFYGEEATNGLNWNYAGTTKDTIEVEETWMPLSNGRASVKRTTYRFVDGLREYVSDTVFQAANYGEPEESVETADVASDRAPGYEFQVTQLGWINCDRFIEVKDKSDLRIELKNYSQPIAYLIFADIHAVMGVKFDETGKAVAAKLPVNYVVDLVVIDKIKDKMHWAKKRATIKADSKLVVETHEIDKLQLQNELKALDN
jgi:hypothetical protein